MTDKGRRSILRAGLACVAGLIVSAHTPYRQWEVYRMKHLLIGASREDAPSYPMAKRIAALLVEVLPESRARVARARTLERLGSLVSTSQLQVLLLSQRYLVDLARGNGSFAAFGPIDVGRLFDFGDLVLVSRAAFPDSHAWIVTRALMENAAGLGGRAPASAGPAPIHPGAQAALDGREPAKDPTGAPAADR